MQQVELIVELLAVIGVVGALAQRIHIALPILLAVAGMLISLIPSIPIVTLEPDTVFFLFLPPLLYIDAFETRWQDLKEVAEVVSLQAIGLVLATVAAVAALVHAVCPDMNWEAAFVLGAIVSPTDAVAATAISREVQLPKKLLEIIKGESLVNDATGLVAYQFAVAAMVTGAFSWTAAGERFLYVGGGGIICGLISGWLLSKLRTRLDHTPVEIVASLLSPFLAYLAAEHMHVSGVLSVVTSGLILGWHGPKMQNATTRLHLRTNWQTITYILNGFCFLLMGLQVYPILKTLHEYPPRMLILWTATAALAPIAVRFVWVFCCAPIYATIRRVPKPCWKDLFVLSWSGMRGVVSLAAALALPLYCANGQPFPYRDLLVFLTIAVIASTLILQGITLPWIVKRFGFQIDSADAELAERQARQLLAREAVRTIDQFARAKDLNLDDPALRKLLNNYLDRSMAYMSPLGEDITKSETWRALQTETIANQRIVLISLRENMSIHEELFRQMENELDLEEAQLNVRS